MRSHKAPNESYNSVVQRAINKIDRNPVEPPVDNPVKVVPGIVLLQVPFTSQSPLVHWDDPEEDAACEEASMLMAHEWLIGNVASKLDKQYANDEIHKIIDFEKEQYGNDIDTSAKDTAVTFKAYYQSNAMEFKENITLQNILDELSEQHIVIVPTNGTALGNTHFRSPGPQTHMIVIRGYDSNKKQFIVNDPGTQYGENYRYSYDTLYNAIRDYPTGDHLPITGNAKNMLVVTR